MKKLIVLGVFLSLGVVATAEDKSRVKSHSHPLIGAIKWDGMHGDKDAIGAYVQETLGPERWHYRLPFYAKIVGKDKVLLDCTPQDVVDKEIQYAANGGLDYWAYVVYPTDDSKRKYINKGLEGYLKSKYRNRIDFCAITASSEITLDHRYIEYLAKLMKEPGYQQVMGGRPLYFIGWIDQKVDQEDKDGDKKFRAWTEDLRGTAVKSGLKEPYFVIMGSTRYFKGDAVSHYLRAPKPMVADVPFVKLTKAVESFWEDCKATGSQVIPLVVTGYDDRPFHEAAARLNSNLDPQVGPDFVHTPTIAELETQFRDALAWVKSNPECTKPNAILMYAWNENSEGGWLVPTLSEGTARLDMIARVLKEARN